MPQSPAVAGGPGTLSSGILAAADPGANGNVTVNLKADIGTAFDRTANDGLTVRSGGASNTGNVSANITNASVFATGHAVVAQNFGSGNVTVTGTGTGTLSSLNGTGIVTQIVNPGKPGNILVDVTQDVSGKTGGILASTNGTGNLKVVAGGNVTATGGIGIKASTSGAGNISVTAGNVTALDGNGIDATTTGTGGISILGSGNVTSGTGVGIFATNSDAANASDIVINRSGGDIKGTIGVFARILNGSGGIAVTTGGNVTGTAGNAIDVQHGKYRREQQCGDGDDAGRWRDQGQWRHGYQRAQSAERQRRYHDRQQCSDPGIGRQRDFCGARRHQQRRCVDQQQCRDRQRRRRPRHA